mgnify:CR=1 FL=1
MQKVIIVGACLLLAACAARHDDGAGWLYKPAKLCLAGKC